MMLLNLRNNRSMDLPECLANIASLLVNSALASANRIAGLLSCGLLNKAFISFIFPVFA